MSDPNEITDDDSYIEIKRRKNGTTLFSYRVEVSNLPDECTQKIVEKMIGAYVKYAMRRDMLIKVKKIWSDIGQSICGLMAKIGVW